MTVALPNENQMDLEAQRQDKERQEEEVTEEPKRVTVQEMAGGSSLSEEALLVSGAQEPSLEWHMKVQQLLRMQSHGTGSSMMRNTLAY